MKKSIATFETTIQVSEDSWDVIRHVLEVDGVTTIDQILEWAKSKPGTLAIKGEIRFSVLPMDSIPHIKRDIA